MSERLKGTRADDGKTKTWSKCDFRGPSSSSADQPLRAPSSARHTFPVSPLGEEILWHNSTGYPHCTDVATEVQKCQGLRKFDVGACPCLPPPATNFLVLRGGKTATDDLNCISTWELLVIAGVVPQCSECLQLAFHFHFRYSVMLPPPPSPNILTASCLYATNDLHNEAEWLQNSLPKSSTTAGFQRTVTYETGLSG